MSGLFACGLTLECLSRAGGFMLFMNSLRYFPVVGAVFFFMWWWQRDWFLPFRIQEKWPKVERIVHELKYSLLAIVIFSVMGVSSFALGKLGYNRIYFDTGRYGVAYLVFAFVLLGLWQETWFYWMHRIVHHKRLFAAVHLTHHKSTNPSPFAAYGFHPFETILEGIYIPIFVMIVPAHPLVILTHLQYTMLFNIYFHSGYEFYPRGWASGRLTRWLNTSTHHNMHHSHVNGNYSLYLNFWDRVMGTNFPAYEATFDEVVARRERDRAARLSARTRTPAAA